MANRLLGPKSEPQGVLYATGCGRTLPFVDLARNFSGGGVTVPALLALEDGSVFHGVSIGASGEATAELVVSTAASGYQELLTDPALAGQFLTLTYPMAGSVGVNAEDAESDAVVARGLVVRELSPIVSNWRAEQSLPEYLQQAGVVGIAGVDTRQITRLISAKGVMGACIQAGHIDEAAAIAAAKNVARATSWEGVNAPQHWQEGIWHWGQGFSQAQDNGPKVAVVDLGATRTLLRVLVEAGAKVSLVPATSTPEELAEYQGVVFSNGPGAAQESPALPLAEWVLSQEKPVFGVGLGMRLLAVAQGAQEASIAATYGASHPVRAEEDGQVVHTDQRSRYALKVDTLPSQVTVTYTSLFDQSVQGIQWQNAPAQGFQGVPKGSVGSAGADTLLRDFVTALNA